jgi:CBS domain-containing protein
VVATSQWLGRTAGSILSERHRRLPGDELVARPTVVTNHAITIPAPADRVWLWLVQMGWHRGGWYTPRWVDQLLFPANLPSATRLIPALQQPLHVGDRIPDGPPGTAWFVVEHVEPPILLVLHSTTHVPATWRARLGASIDWTWIFALEDIRDGRTRLLMRTRARTKPWWLTGAYVAALIPADYLMATGMLEGIRQRVCGPRRRKVIDMQRMGGEVIMTTVTRVAPQIPLGQVTKLLRERGVTAVPVVDEEDHRRAAAPGTRHAPPAGHRRRQTGRHGHTSRRSKSP